MKKTYKRITYEDRIKIEIHLKLGSTKTQIADVLGFSKGAIGREINRCPFGKYESIVALHLAVSKSSSRKNGKTF